MVQEEMVLEGNRYQGRFKIKECGQQITERIDNEVGYYNHTYFEKWWEGEGIVLDKQTSRKEKFLIHPKGNCESDIVILSDREEIMKRVQDYKGIIDLALQIMYESAEKSKNIIPKIRPVPLDLQKLLELGLISEESGQLRIPLNLCTLEEKANL